MNKRTVATGILLVATLLLAGWQIATESLWADEVFTAKVTGGSWWQLFKQARYDFVQPPLGYVVVKLFRYVISDVSLALRLPSLLAALAAVLALCRLNRFDAAILVAANSYFLHYAQEARCYALFVAVFAWLLWALADPARRVWIFPLSAALVWTHYFGALYLLFLLPLFPSARRPFLFAAPTLLPWLAAVAYKLTPEKVDNHMGWLPAITLESFALFWSRMLPGSTSVWAGSLAFAALLGVLAWTLLRRDRSVAGYGVLALGPPLLVFLVSLPPLDFHLVHPRYLTPTIVAAAFFLCLAVERCANPRIAFALATLTAVGAGLPSFWQERQQHRRFDARHVAQDLSARQTASGLPLYSADEFAILMTLNFHAGRPLVAEIPKVPLLRGKRFWLLSFIRPGLTSSSEAVPSGLRFHGFTGRPIARYSYLSEWSHRDIEVTEWSDTSGVGYLDSR